jgi:hypothetical protein
METFLQYSKLTYEDLIQQIQNKLNADPRFENFRESAIAQMLVEIFAGTTDLTNYYLQRRAEESYLETAKLTSSMITLAKQLGYIVARPIPATTSLTMTLKGPFLAAVSEGDTIQLPMFSEFSYKGIKFLLKNTYTYTFTSADALNCTSPNYLRTISLGLLSSPENYTLYSNDAVPVSATDTIPIEMFQGEFKTAGFLAVNNSSLGSKFQTFKIADPTFSNYYGTEDLGYDHDSGLYAYPANVTRVGIGIDEASALLPNGSTDFRIDRRSLINNENLNDVSIDTSTAKVCLARTAPDQGIEIVFGDGNYAAIGPVTNNDNVFVKYLSTVGAPANQIGVIGQKVSRANATKTNTNMDITQNVTFTFNSNIVGGADMESVESIRNNAPGIYYALDRVVTKGDYAVYLRSLTSPIDIKNAVAWGEQEVGAPDKKMFNVAFFSCVGSLYNVIDQLHNVKTTSATNPNESLTTSVLDEDYSPMTVQPTSYFNVYVKEKVIDSINEIILSPTSNITTVVNKLDNRSELTVKNVYISPIIQEFELQGEIYVQKLSDITTTKIKINNAIYEYLNEYADFDKPVYLSNIIDIIENFPEIVYTDLQLVPIIPPVDYRLFHPLTDGDIAMWWYGSSAHPGASASPIGGETYDLVRLMYINRCLYWLGVNPGSSASDLGSTTATFLTEDWFYNTFMKDIYKSCKLIIYYGPLWYYHVKSIAHSGDTEDVYIEQSQLDKSYAESVYFLNVMARIHNDLIYKIKLNDMKDSEGATTRDIITYSMKFEIPQVKITASYIYK